MPPRFHLLIGTQFVAALADNALLIVTIGLLQRSGEPAWWVPLLKLVFVSLYVGMAPLLGPLADAWPKARMMMGANALKGVAVLAMLMGLSPLLAFLCAGLGSALYAPAKYGLLTEQVPAAQLVRANAWLEVSVVGAVLGGTVLGGWLVSSGFAALSGAWARPAALGGLMAIVGDRVVASGLAPSVVAVLALYAIAQLLNLGVRCSGLRHATASWHPVALWKDFWRDNRVLSRDPLGGLSLAVTVLCWGAGAVLQLAVLQWAVDVLGLGLDQAAYLQAVVAVGVVLGAVVAGRLVSLDNVPRLVPLGAALGLLVGLGRWVDSVPWALPLLAAVGAVGGMLIVPMNALLQHRGYQLLTAGRSVALQGFNENAGVLVMLAVYAAGLRSGLDSVWLLTALGVWLVVGSSWLWWRWSRSGARRASAVRASAAESSSCSN
jgi:MFS transporter, LPLT family, lysophospholipid transporter